ncbi:Peptidase M16 inactive domain protein [Jannaschia seosinensis]|uniref:Peptidase M16 inactive domain protein n=1 Tax=Jannaschia seosinensis TaxID=313367 RepID=A0A0M7B736_9RHOB|nr:pitrilysin family protein [Jannaschia seosinensis]CUH16029.1 Peptidase M16 inactive domain protein [Jannaschia seosinensis]
MTRLILTLVACLLPLKALAIEIQEVTSPGGITAWLVEEESIPFVSMDILFEGGANEDAPARRGATNMMMGLLEEGAGERDNREFAEAVEAAAARLSFETNNDTVGVGFTFLTENREESVALLRDALVSPRFDAPAVERVRDQVLAGLASDARDPREIASRTLAALSFPGHPYGTPLEGTPETVAALSIEDLRHAHQRALTRDRAVIGVTGDITPEELGPLLDRLLGDLPTFDGEPVSDIDPATEGGVTVVDFPSPQSVVLFGHEGIDFDDPDYFAAYILNHILGGGGFGSRLTEELRVDRGLTYGIGTSLVPRDHAAQILGQFASSNDKTAEAVELVREEWTRMAEEGATEAEIDAAKTYITGAYPLRFDGNSRIAAILAGMQSNDLPIDYIDTRNDKVMAVTPEDIARVAETLLDPEALHFVVVGKPEDLETKAF